MSPLAGRQNIEFTNRQLVSLILPLLAVQVLGKLKGTITVPVDSDQDTVVEAAKANEKVAKAIAGMQIVKVIHVKNKLVNLIVKPC